MEKKTINLSFEEDISFQEFNKLSENKGIYFHYLEDKNKRKRIIYVGMASNLKSRISCEFSDLDKYNYTLFEICDDGLNIKYIAGDINGDKHIELRDNLKEKIRVACFTLEEETLPLKNIESTIINFLYRKAISRNYLLNLQIGTSLPDTEIVLKNSEISFNDIPEGKISFE